MARTGRYVALLLAGALAFVPAAASSHEPSGDETYYAAVIESITPALPQEVSLYLREHVFVQLVAENRGPQVLEVLDERGEPFLRIGPEGVEADTASSAWLAAASPRHAELAPAAGPPAWKRVSVLPWWAWFDTRLHGAVPEGAWSLQLRYGSEVVEVRGRLRPLDGGAVVPRLLAVEPSIEGLRFGLTQAPVPQLFVSSSVDGEVIVFAQGGEPFVRVTPEGAWLNARSPAILDHLSAAGAAPQIAIDPAARPRWVRAASVPETTWFDRRPLVEHAAVPAAAYRAGGETELSDWSLGGSSAGVPFAIEGRTIFIPPGAAGARWPERGDPAARGAALALVAGSLALLGAMAVRSLRAR